jgi:diguanylate cyclase (GGDEF)-like protein/PAS domain S-box-containing protein
VDDEGDLTIRLRNVTEALRVRNQQYRLLAEQASDGVLIADSGGSFIGVSPQASTLLHYTRAELFRLGLVDLVEGDTTSGDLALLLGIGPGQRLARPFRLRRGDSTWAELEVSARRLDDGRLQLALRDFGERRRVAQAYRESEVRYERLVASAPDAILLEVDGRIVFSNPALRRLLNLGPGVPVPAHTIADLIHPDERMRAARLISECGSAGLAGLRFTTKIRRTDGSFVPVEVAATAVTHQGRPATQVLLRQLSEETTAPVLGDVYHDGLTGLTSRFLVPDRLSVALAQAYRHRTRVGVVHIDIDHFAATNATIGRDGGDRLLRLVGRRLAHCVRQGDTAARLDADAFVLVLPGLHHAEDAVKIADKVLGSLRRPFPLPDRVVSVTASLGVSVFPEDGEDAPALLSAAEAAGRRARVGGGDSLEVCAPAALEAGYDPLELEAGLRALRSGRLDLGHAPSAAGVLYYQPIYELASSRVMAAEALLRWQHPQLGLVFPESFLSRSDFTGLILNIGPWILRTATIQARTWHKMQPKLRIAVNLSPPELMTRTPPQTIRAALEETGFPPPLLQLEVPEGHIVSSLPKSLDMLHRLRALGVLLVLDRVAVRYSSLGRLSELPVDGLKLDLAFLRGPKTHPEDVSLLTAVTAVARGLKMRVLAQGVENEGQVELLAKLGCQEAQGFHLGPPCPAPALTAQLADRRASPAEGNGQ